MLCRFLKLTTLVMACAVLAALSAPAPAQIFVENFDHPTGANEQVVFRADPIYLATGASPSGGDRNGNRPYYNSFVVQNNNFPPFSPPGTWGLIDQDQSGSGYFLYEGTYNGAASSYAGTFWRTFHPMPVKKNTDYVLSFYLTNSNSGNPAIVQPYVNGSPISTGVSAQGYWNDGIVGDGWQQFASIWNSDEATTADLSLVTLRVSGAGNDFGIDTISLSSIVPVLSTLVLTPNALIGGASATGTLMLSGTTTADLTVKLTSSNTAVTIPGSVVIPAGQSSATFAISTAPVPANITASIKAVLDDVSETAKMIVKAPTITGFSVKPTSVKGGSSTSVLTITLSGNAPTGGLSVRLTSSDATVLPLSKATVPAGANSVQTTLAPSAVSASEKITITGTLNSTSMKTKLTVTP